MEAILHVFSEVLSLQVSAEQIDRGQNLLRTAAWIVAASADTPSEEWSTPSGNIRGRLSTLTTAPSAVARR